MKPQLPLAVALAAFVAAATNVVSAQTLGIPGDGTMPYERAVSYSASAPSVTNAPAGGIARVSTAYSTSAAIRTDGAPLDVLSQELISNASSGAATTGETLTLSFENTAKATATNVAFEVDSLSGPSDADLRGSFAPGVEIEHKTVAIPEGYGVDQVSVKEIDYSDGSTWRNPELLQPQRQASAS